ncbi:uncharacterized protein G2W53_021804 [Senna tora]|uniref:Uncharacterized protein n=1 Tax=Senna tora TaxID=362788 RepID=A0A834TMY1_9FABA|nr:uncharacterized protein G2W53_021804 [Senna tora]
MSTLLLNHNLLAKTKLSSSKNSLANPRDLASGKMIGSVEECNELNHLAKIPMPTPMMQSKAHTTPKMQSEAEIPMPSPANSEDSDENMNLPIALKKGEAITMKYSRKFGHTKEACFKIIGYPDWTRKLRRAWWKEG